MMAGSSMHKKSEFQFGVTRVRGVFASPDNPIRDGIFVEHVGKLVRLTDGKGEFWRFDRDAVVIHRATETEAELQARCDELHDKIRRQRYPEQYAKSDEAIPEGVTYSVEADNFYLDVTRTGMGNEFYSKWQSRRAEFPQRELTR
jgi:hypothetical protein